MEALRQAFTLDTQQVENMLKVIPLLPLLGAVVTGLFGRWIGNERSGLIATATVLGSFVVSVLVFFALLGGEISLASTVYTWFSAGDLQVNLGLNADRLSGILLLVITGVGALIHIYSTVYMQGDRAAWRYFAYLNLFVAAMLLLVLGDNLLTLFVGWEGVGLCSYLLIGFWYADEEKASAGKKAFLVNRVGDFAFLVGMFILFATFSTLNVGELRQKASEVSARSQIVQVDGQSTELRGFATTVEQGIFADRTVTNEDGSSSEKAGSSYKWVVGVALLLLFIGATGKSAQIPLFVWLPDAMAGPILVSALIHAATMVTAGVYMIARLSFLYVEVPEVLAIVAIIGVLTAFFAALIAFTQNDIKKVLAYSTVSQLGYMFVGVGAAAFGAGVYHLFTHAFFKAALFLGSGAVIHGLSEEQDIRKMGGLKKYMPHTRWTFLIGTITIAGVLPFSGFFSKDAILHEAFVSDALNGVAGWLGPAIYLLGTVTALFTAIYMFRLYFLVFEGDYRGDAKPEESPPAMTVPLWILAGLSVAVALLGLPGNLNWFNNFLDPVLTAFPGAQPHPFELWPFVVALLVAAGGTYVAYSIYGKGLPEGGSPFARKFPALARAAEQKFWVDEFYDAVVVKPMWALGRVLYQVVDVLAIDRLVIGAAKLTSRLSGETSKAQNGDLSRYAAVTAVAAAILVLWVVLL